MSCVRLYSLKSALILEVVNLIWLMPNQPFGGCKKFYRFLNLMVICPLLLIGLNDPQNQLFVDVSAADRHWNFLKLSLMHHLARFGWLHLSCGIDSWSERLLRHLVSACTGHGPFDSGWGGDSRWQQCLSWRFGLLALGFWALCYCCRRVKGWNGLDKLVSNVSFLSIVWVKVDF
jgi:hypothetical protein